jgi:eukaryotic-like serine/threonine-protein kinase
MSPKVTLTITSENLKGQGFIFETRNTCIIGRANDCNPHLPSDKNHRTVSRYHCLLDINPPAIRIRDFGSLNGTYINGQLIGRRHPETRPEDRDQMYFPEHDLQAGDEIQLGNTIFRVDVEGINDIEATKPASLMLANDQQALQEQVQNLVRQTNQESPNLLKIQGYTLIKLLGQGGFGAVYLARHDRTGEEIALKVLLPQIAHNQTVVEMFLREVKTTRILDHPNLVKLKDCGYADSLFFFTLDYCQDGSVADLIQKRRGPLSLDEAMPIILQTLDGLTYAHNVIVSDVKQEDGSLGQGRGLIHRDLKPANLFLTTIAGKRIAKIGDYGLAKAFDLAGLSGQTMTGTIAGTPHFMPRQQVINFKYAKPEVDIWAMAASLYYMLTCTYPRDFVAGQEPFLVVLNTDAVPILKRNPAIPKALAEVIDLALIDRPAISFQDAATFKQALLQAM